MELPQPHSFGTQGRKPTHDFLSLYSPAQQDPILTPPGQYLKTHDLLQPLERAGKNVVTGDEITSTEKPLLPAPTSLMEHILPGGIGTYSISHISYINQSQRLSKPEGVMTTTAQSRSGDRNDENANCGSYTGNGFTLWEESAGEKGKTGKENIVGNVHVIRDEEMNVGGAPWTRSMERPSRSSSVHNHPNRNISSLSSSRHSAQKNQSFVDMLQSAKPSQEDEDDDGEFVIKTETSSHHKVELETKPDVKPNILRSKHSATEQRRRSKINDRFSMLREIIPHGDQKRDKASFLLEVIEYIRFLQEKVHKYEDSYQGWSNEPPKMTPWKSQRPTEGFIDQPQVENGVPGPALVYAANLDENKSVAPNIPPKGQNILDTGMDSIKEIDEHPRSSKEVSPLTERNICAPCCGNTSSAAPASRHEPGAIQSCYGRSGATVMCDELKDQELMIENGTISISTIYSQGLLGTLSQALQSSGVELSEASISIQIDLGKRANPPNSSFKRSEVGEEHGKGLKRFKT